MDLHADFLIIGSGIAGLRAAVLALSAGGLVFCMWATYRGGGLAP